MLNRRSRKIKTAKNLNEEKQDDLQKSTYLSQDLFKDNFTFTSCTRNKPLLINYVQEAIIGLGVLINQNLYKEEFNHYNQ